MADITKSGAQKDEWAQIAAAAIRKGAEFTVSDDLGLVLEIFVVHDSTNAHANGAVITVEVNDQASGNDEGWVPHEAFNGIRSSGGTANKADCDQNSSGATLYIGATANFETKMDRYFAKDMSVIADSEVVRNAGFSSNDYITCLDALTNQKDSSDDVFDIVDSWLCRVAQEFRRARVLIWNDDADCTICSMTREAKATDIE